MSHKVTSALHQVICILEEVKQEFHAEIENLRLGQAELRAEIDALQAAQQAVQQAVQVVQQEVQVVQQEVQEVQQEVQEVQQEVQVVQQEVQEVQQEVQEVQVVQQVKIKPKRKLKNYIIIEEKDSYTTDEISLLSDYELCVEFGRIKLNSKCTMYCKHCNKETPFENWVHSIRKRCMKQGLSRKTTIPRSCDKQQSVNSIRNQINNRHYRIMRSPNTSDKKKRRSLEERQLALEKLGIKIRPYKYNY